MSCLYPRIIRNPKTKQLVTISCRKCHNCRVERISELQFMCLMAQQQGYKFGTGASFVTLTYDNEHIPLKVIDGKPYGYLEKKHFQDYFSKIRHHYLKEGKYVPQMCCVGEYGEQDSRPHYHSLIFGASSLEIEKLNRKFWRKGIHQCGVLRQGGIRYVIDYMFKQSSDTFKELFKKKELPPPFLIHSTKLGQEFFLKYFDYDPADFTYIRNGKRCVIPRSYRLKLPGGDSFIYEDTKGIAQAYEEGKPYDVYSLENAFKSAELDVIKRRQKGSPADSLQHSLTNYVTDTSKYFSDKQIKRTEFKNLLISMGLPTERSFWIDKIDAISPQYRKDIISYFILLD